MNKEEQEDIELQSFSSGETEPLDYFWDKNGEVPSFLNVDLDAPLAASSPDNSALVKESTRPFLFNPTFKWPPRALTSEAPVLQFSRIPRPIHLR